MDSHQTADIEAQKTHAGKDDARKIEDTVLNATPADGQSDKDVPSASAAPEPMADPDRGNVDDDSASATGLSPEGAYALLGKLSARTHVQGRHMFIFPKLMAELNILQLQNEVISTQANILDAESKKEGSGELLKQLEDLLHRYATALRDFEYMSGLDHVPLQQQYSYLGRSLPGFSASILKQPMLHRMLARGDIMMKRMPDKVVATSDPLRRWLSKVIPRRFLVSYYDDEHVTPKPTPSPLVNRLARFTVAITGGLSLVVPMLIMSINQNLIKSLMTTSVAVVLFAGLVSVVFSASNAETLGITAAYAAVLVVFVGTSA